MLSMRSRCSTRHAPNQACISASLHKSTRTRRAVNITLQSRRHRSNSFERYCAQKCEARFMQHSSHMQHGPVPDTRSVQLYDLYVQGASSYASTSVETCAVRCKLYTVILYVAKQRVLSIAQMQHTRTTHPLCNRISCVQQQHPPEMQHTRTAHPCVTVSDVCNSKICL